MKSEPFFAVLSFVILFFLGLVSFVGGMLFAGFASEGCYPLRYSLENTFCLFVWVGALGLGALVPSILVWKQRVLAALVSMLPFGLCSCCACLAYAGTICS